MHPQEIEVVAGCLLPSLSVADIKWFIREHLLSLPLEVVGCSATDNIRCVTTYKSSFVIVGVCVELRNVICFYDKSVFYYIIALEESFYRVLIMFLMNENRVTDVGVGVIIQAVCTHTLYDELSFLVTIIGNRILTLLRFRCHVFDNRQITMQLFSVISYLFGYSRRNRRT